MANPFCYVELHSNDLKKARDFYTQMFDWKLEEIQLRGGAYTAIRVGQGAEGGMLTNQAKGMPSNWLAYVGVDDVAAATKKAKQLGAKVVVDVMQVGDSGSMSIITDPSGATIGLWQARR
jgi:predicted enzyme related to lactoylglutathione lyase